MLRNAVSSAVLGTDGTMEPFQQGRVTRGLRVGTYTRIRAAAQKAAAVAAVLVDPGPRGQRPCSSPCLPSRQICACAQDSRQTDRRAKAPRHATLVSSPRPHKPDPTIGTR